MKLNSIACLLVLCVGILSILAFAHLILAKTSPTFPQCSSSSFDEHLRSVGKNSEVKVLVTGALGFIGSHVARFCKDNLGFKVIAVDDLSGGFRKNLANFEDSSSKIVIGDLRNKDFVKKLFQNHGPFNHVYHLAAYAAEGLSHFIRHFNYNNNLLASVNILNEALKQSSLPNFVFTSSIAAFGASDHKLPLTELSPMLPEDPYGIAKYSFELDLKAAHHMFGLNYIIFRPHNVYGPGQNIADKFRNAVGIFMNQIMRNEKISIFGDGLQTRAFSYISDVSSVIAASVTFSAALNQDFFVGSDAKFSVLELARAVKISMNAAQTDIVHFDARNEVVHAYPSHDKLKCVFNKLNSVSLEEGLKITADFVKKQGHFEPTGYTDIEILKNLPKTWKTWLDIKKK